MRTHTPHHKHTDSQEFSSSFLSCLLQALSLPWEGSLHTLTPVKRIRWAEGKLLESLKKISRNFFGPFSNVNVRILVVCPLLPRHFENVPVLLCSLFPNSLLTPKYNKILPNEQTGLQIA